MKKLLAPFLVLLFLASCGTESMTDMQPDLENSSADLLSEVIDTDLLNAHMRIAPTVSCAEGCIEPGSSVFFPVSDMATGSAGPNTKAVSYSAYNTETDFVVEVTYAITAGSSKAKAILTIAIDGNEVEYTEVSSGTTVSHTVPLADGWAGCDQVAFSVVQEGLGTPITFSESYSLFPVCAEESLKIGDAYQGGIIFYILQPGDPGYVPNKTHGIIAAPSDQSTGIQWWNGSYTTTGATGTDLGTGQANTTAIVTSQGPGSYAAQLCNDLVLGGYDDWYLPSRDELTKLYLNRAAVGVFGIDSSFGLGIYWSSSELGDSGASTYIFSTGSLASSTKSILHSVRAVRSF